MFMFYQATALLELALVGTLSHASASIMVSLLGFDGLDFLRLPRLSLSSSKRALEKTTHVHVLTS
jgi:hypothetical protein